MRFCAFLLAGLSLVSLVLAQEKASTRNSASVLVYSDGGGFLLGVPAGWIADREIGKRVGTCCVYYPKGSSWDRAETVMYPNIASKGERLRTLEALMQADLARFRRGNPEMTYDDKPDIALPQNRVAKVRIFHHVIRGSSEAVAYVDEDQSIAMFVASSKTKKGLNESLPLFRSVVESYTHLDARSAKEAKEHENRLADKH